MPGGLRRKAIWGGLLALAVLSLPAIVIPVHLVTPPGGCPAVFGQPMWTDWLFFILVPGGVLAASLSAGAFVLRMRRHILAAAGFAVLGGLEWILLFVLSSLAFPPPC